MGKASRKKKIHGEITRQDGGKQGGAPGKVPPKHNTRLVIIIMAVSFVVYFNAMFNDFVWDDTHQVLNNPWIKDIRYIPEIFSKNGWSFEIRYFTSNYYRPLLHIIYMINYHIFGFHPWGFHLVNIIFHGGVSALVLLVALEILNGSMPSTSFSYRSPPFIAAVLFATHPIHTEAVTWIAGIPDLSFAFFYLLSFYLYIRSQGAWKSGYLLSVISFFLATLCKEPAVTLPIIFIVYDYLFHRAAHGPSGYLKRYLPYVVAAGVYFILRFHALGSFAPAKQSMALGAYQYGVNVVPFFVHYLIKLLLPIHLNVFHVFHPITSVLEIKGILSFIITGVFIFLALIAAKKNKVVFFFLLFLIVPLLPVFYIPALGKNAFAERYLYLPSLGFVVLLSLLHTWIRKKLPKVAISMSVATVLLIALYSIGTITRNAVWKDDCTLWKDAVQKSPDGDTPHNNLGKCFYKEGRIKEAIEEFMIALNLNPLNVDTHYNLATVYFKQGRIEEAVKEFQATVKLRADYAPAYNNLGNCYLWQGDLDKAATAFRTALNLRPDYADAHGSLGNVYLRQGRTDEAIREFQTALKINPDSAEAYYNLGGAYLKQGRIDEAVRELQTVLRLNPDDAEARHTLETLYKKKPRFN